MTLPWRILLVSAWFPPRAGGSAIVMDRLLHQLSPDQVVIATVKLPPDENCVSTEPMMWDVHHVLGGGFFNTPGYQLRSTLGIPAASNRLASLAKVFKCRGIVAVYPNLQLLIAAYLAHLKLKLPWAVYFHDAPAETTFGGYLGWLADYIQKRAMRTAFPIWAISDGLASYFQHSYGVSVGVLEHIVDSRMLTTQTKPPPQQIRLVLHSGAVGEMNAAALKRILRSLEHMTDTQCVFLGPYGYRQLKRFHLHSSRVSTEFLGSSWEAFERLSEADVLVASLSWPDESAVGRWELATMFPTKIVDYLAAARPLLIHCPSHYALARFINKHNCGWVVSDRSVDALKETFNFVASNREEVIRRMRNAREVARKFDGRRIGRRFVEDLAKAWLN